MSCPQVVWLPPEPANSCPSMIRYWSFLWEAARLRREWSISSPLGLPPPVSAGSPEQNRWVKNFRKYAGYPAQVKFQGPRDAVYHLLDHSWAHLLPWTPKGCPTVATVHDLIPLRYPENLTPRQLERWRWVVGHLKKADAVMADSTYTRNEAVELLGIREDRISVVPLGVRPCSPAGLPSVLLSGAVQRLQSRETCLIAGCLGSSAGRKNLKILIESVLLLNARGIPVSLLRAGTPLPQKLRDMAEPLKNAGKFLDLGILDDSQVEHFYRSIDVLVMPSLYEGFGLPVLEAMAASTPVICSSATSLPEVAGDAALLFDPLSAEELAARLQSVISREKREELIRKGTARAAAFSWDRTLEACFEIYRRVA